MISYGCVHLTRSHRWCNCWHAPLKCCRLWVWVLSGQTKDYKIVTCCFCTKHTALKSKHKYCLAQNQDIVTEWSDMFTSRLFLQWVSAIKIQQSRHYQLIQCNCSYHDIAGEGEGGIMLIIIIKQQSLTRSILLYFLFFLFIAGKRGDI